MYLFLFTVIPLCYFLYHAIEGKKYALRGAGFNFFCGSITSVFYCFVGFLVFTAYRLPEYSFKNNFIYFFLTGTVFPVSCCVLLYLLLEKNDWKFKFLMFSDVISSFYVVFLPYRIISVYDVPDYFCLFILPVITCCCLYMFRKIVVYVTLIKASLWKKIVFGILATVVAFVSPAVVETLYFVGYALWIRCVAEFVTVLFAILALILFRGEVSFTGVFPPEWKKPDAGVQSQNESGKATAKLAKKAKRKAEKTSPAEEKASGDEISGSGTALDNAVEKDGGKADGAESSDMKSTADSVVVEAEQKPETVVNEHVETDAMQKQEKNMNEPEMTAEEPSSREQVVKETAGSAKKSSAEKSSAKKSKSVQPAVKSKSKKSSKKK